MIGNGDVCSSGASPATGAARLDPAAAGEPIGGVGVARSR